MRDLQYMIDVMTAARDGKKIEWRLCNAKEQWKPLIGYIPCSWNTVDYRIAPEPRKAREWTLFHKDGHLEVCTEPLADCPFCPHMNPILVREVLPDDKAASST